MRTALGRGDAAPRSADAAKPSTIPRQVGDASARTGCRRGLDQGRRPRSRAGEAGRAHVSALKQQMHQGPAPPGRPARALDGARQRRVAVVAAGSRSAR